jgi:hypothetical protein
MPVFSLRILKLTALSDKGMIWILPRLALEIDDFGLHSNSL